MNALLVAALLAPAPEVEEPAPAPREAPAVWEIDFAPVPERAWNRVRVELVSADGTRLAHASHGRGGGDLAGASLLIHLRKAGWSAWRGAGPTVRVEGYRGAPVVVVVVIVEQPDGTWFPQEHTPTVRRLPPEK